MTQRRVVFVTGTRADFGKLKSLMRVVEDRPDMHMSVFVTGMHMLDRYGATWHEVQKAGFRNIHPFINQNLQDSMAAVMGKTVLGFTDYVHERRPDLIVVHGDRVETLACASVGALTGTRVAHIEGGEISGTVDETIRQAVTKLSHIHLVANRDAAANLVQLGESSDSIHVIGSPDIDVMESGELPATEEVRRRYDIPFEQFGVLLFHPVTSELPSLGSDVAELVDAVLASGIPHVAIYPNNDPGSDRIMGEYRRFEGIDRIRLIPSMSFERFLTTMRQAKFVVGNSSAGIREAPHYGVPTINVGSRQDGRWRAPSVVDVPCERNRILEAMKAAESQPRVPTALYGVGNSAELFAEVLDSGTIWTTPIQKQFIPL